MLSKAPGCGFRHKERGPVLLLAFASVFRHKDRVSVLHFTRIVREVNVVQRGGMRLLGDQVRESQFNASAPAQGEKRAAFAGSSPGLGPLAEMSVQHRSETDWATAQANAFASRSSRGLSFRSVLSNGIVRKRALHLYLVQ